MRNTEQRTERALAAASKLISHYGFDKTTMEEIAREAGISKGALYLVWANKDALFEALLSHEMLRMLSDLRRRIAADDAGGQIAQLYRHSLEALHSNALMAALYTRDSRVLGDFVRRQDFSRYTSRLMLGNSTIRAMQHAGLIRADLSPEVISYLLSSIALGFMSIGSLIPPGNAPAPQQVIDGLCAIIERGVGEQHGSSTSGKIALLAMIDLMMAQYRQSE